MPPAVAWVRSMVLFFFSSRRRHTRLVSDWSSDVCSSDLEGAHVDTYTLIKLAPWPARRWKCRYRLLMGEKMHDAQSAAERSEERRVGKECRARGGAWRGERRALREGSGREVQGEGRKTSE